MRIAIGSTLQWRFGYACPKLKPRFLKLTAWQDVILWSSRPLIVPQICTLLIWISAYLQHDCEPWREVLHKSTHSWLDVDLCSMGTHCASFKVLGGFAAGSKTESHCPMHSCGLRMWLISRKPEWYKFLKKAHFDKKLRLSKKSK